MVQDDHVSAGGGGAQVRRGDESCPDLLAPRSGVDVQVREVRRRWARDLTADPVRVLGRLHLAHADDGAVLLGDPGPARTLAQGLLDDWPDRLLGSGSFRKAAQAGVVCLYGDVGGDDRVQVVQRGRATTTSRLPALG